ncbi:DUF4329 domain-containing protein [Hafnia alvei]|uniref:DUF4329 domain-containing protein n=1 Tax=Hafnia alvei TaxID=569 RepID=UPI00187D63CC|nr:DUF4329 domain-containing protein [Hafnia alvei]
MCNADSIKNNREYGGLICKKDKAYFQTGPIEGSLAGVSPHKAPCPDDSQEVGIYHTHGYFSDQNGNFVLKQDNSYDSLHFSPQDKKSAIEFSKEKNEYTSYLGTPELKYYKLDPKKGKVSILK